MTDTVSSTVRSHIMANVPQKNSIQEKTVRSLLHNLGCRFRLHRKDLPGSPDIVLPKYKSAVFVHGCFWHQHRKCKLSRRPTSNVMYWNKKLDENIARDKRNVLKLKKLGWNVLIIWQCEIKSSLKLQKKLIRFLSI